MTKKKSPALKPCPFCGSTVPDFHWGGDSPSYVQCHGCLAMGPGVGFVKVKEVARADATLLWNRRATPRRKQKAKR